MRAPQRAAELAELGHQQGRLRVRPGADRLCREWQIPLAARWLRDQRDRYGF